ncbi:chromate efflux transporter [Ruania halotolerans]|uniref:chromate efflux transporter n=1 Tax=Ruania halotolerans TaxID=2897773 RepID=UPI001E3D5284|nr:chromate efflux transporter [Ruania halotolerans]UFU05644.1 chromate efflux transporter [Ruania halotolerans]
MSTDALPTTATGDSVGAVHSGRGHPGTVSEVFWTFLRLGLTSFGGPVAHLGYFRDAVVTRRRWLSERSYADIVALCQFLPGPASSQVGMALGLQRAGVGGLLAAWFAFTMPSAILLVAFAFGVTSLGDGVGAGWLLGLKAAAVAVVAQAVLGMAKTLTPDARRATIAAAAMVVVLLVPGALIQVVAIAVGAGAGLLWLRGIEGAGGDDNALELRVSRRAGMVSLTAFTVLLVGLPILAGLLADPTVRLVDVFYRAGSLVFGGGHVVLPLLETATVPTGLVSHDTFLAGYGAAQAVPGPLFTFAAFLGASSTVAPTGLVGAGIALLAIFLPAALLVIGVLPFWDRLRHIRSARQALLGVNAAVVGILAAALYDPVFTQGITSPATLALAVTVFIAQTRWNVPAWAAVIGAGVVGYFLL